MSFPSALNPSKLKFDRQNSVCPILERFIELKIPTLRIFWLPIFTLLSQLCLHRIFQRRFLLVSLLLLLQTCPLPLTLLLARFEDPSSRYFLPTMVPFIETDPRSKNFTILSLKKIFTLLYINLRWNPWDQWIPDVYTISLKKIKWKSHRLKKEKRTNIIQNFFVILLINKRKILIS